MVLFPVAAHKKFENVVGDARAAGLDAPDAGPVLCPPDAGPDARRSPDDAISRWQNWYWRMRSRAFTAERFFVCLDACFRKGCMRYRGGHSLLVGMLTLPLRGSPVFRASFEPPRLPGPGFAPWIGGT